MLLYEEIERRVWEERLDADEICGTCHGEKTPDQPCRACTGPDTAELLDIARCGQCRHGYRNPAHCPHCRRAQKAGPA